MVGGYGLAMVTFQAAILILQSLHLILKLLIRHLKLLIRHRNSGVFHLQFAEGLLELCHLLLKHVDSRVHGFFARLVRSGMRRLRHGRRNLSWGNISLTEVLVLME
jgi:hypothetical protein